MASPSLPPPGLLNHHLCSVLGSSAKNLGAKTMKEPGRRVDIDAKENAVHTEETPAELSRVSSAGPTMHEEPDPKLVLKTRVQSDKQSAAALLSTNEDTENPSFDELSDQCRSLQAEVALLKQQLQRKEEQRLTAIRLLKQAKKKHDEDKVRQRERDGGSPTSIGGRSSISLYSMTPSAMTLGRKSMVGGYRRPMGLKELIDPDVRLAQVLEKLSSEPVLNVLENIADKLQREAASNLTTGSFTRRQTNMSTSSRVQ